MGTMIVRGRYKDYATWRSIFDSGKRLREAAGFTNERVFRSVDDQSEIVVVMDTKDIQKAKDFAASADLKEAMMKANPVDAPTIYFLESA